MAPRETEDNTYAKLWRDRQRALLYAIIFSIVVNFKSKSNSDAIRMRDGHVV